MDVRTRRDEYGTHIEVVDSGKGKWEPVRCDDQLAHWGDELVGFGGENHLLIVMTSWQSGNMDVTVIHPVVDSETKTAHELLKPGDLDAGINRLIEQVGITD